MSYKWNIKWDGIRNICYKCRKTKIFYIPVNSCSGELKVCLDCYTKMIGMKYDSDKHCWV